MFDLVEDPELDLRYRQIGDAHVQLCKEAGDAVTTDALSGRLYFSSSGWLLLSVPNALGQGAFDAIDEAGAELPTSGKTGRYNAHITVMRPDEIAQIGGPEKITERGHSYRYSLGPVKEVEPRKWDGISKVWYIEVHSPELKELRRSYGLSDLPNEGKHAFHITFAIRKTRVLQGNGVSKAAAARDALSPEHHCPNCSTGHGTYPRSHPERKTCSDCGHKWTGEVKIAAAGENCPHCNTPMERGEDGTCNHCGKPWPLKAASWLLDLLEKEAGPLKKKKKPGTSSRNVAAGSLVALLGGGSAGGVMASGALADKVPYNVTRFPMQNKADVIRGSIYPGAAPAEIEGVGPYVRTATKKDFADFIGAQNSHYMHSSVPDAAAGVKQTLALGTDTRPARVEMLAHGMPGAADFGGGRLGVTSRDEAEILRQIHSDASGRFLNQSTGKRLGEALKGQNIGCLELGSCNLGNDKAGIIPGAAPTGDQVAQAAGFPVVDYQGYGYGNSDQMSVIRGFSDAKPYKDTPMTHPGKNQGIVIHKPEGGQDRVIDKTLEFKDPDGNVRKVYSQSAPMGGEAPQQIYKALYKMGPYSSLLGAALAPALNKKWGLRAALAGTAGTLPMLLAEGAVSHGKGLANMELGGGGVGSYLKEYGHLAPYAALAALPMASWGLAKLLGRWKDEKTPDAAKERDKIRLNYIKKKQQRMRAEPQVAA